MLRKDNVALTSMEKGTNKTKLLMSIPLAVQSLKAIMPISETCRIEAGFVLQKGTK